MQEVTHRCPQASPNLHVKHFLRALSWPPSMWCHGFMFCHSLELSSLFCLVCWKAGLLHWANLVTNCHNWTGWESFLLIWYYSWVWVHVPTWMQQLFPVWVWQSGLSPLYSRYLGSTSDGTPMPSPYSPHLARWHWAPSLNKQLNQAEHQQNQGSTYFPYFA